MLRRRRTPRLRRSCLQTSVTRAPFQQVKLPAGLRHRTAGKLVGQASCVREAAGDGESAASCPRTEGIFLDLGPARSGNGFC